MKDFQLQRLGVVMRPEPGNTMEAAGVLNPAAARGDGRDDLGQPDRLDVYYGMADNQIGVARLNVPERLPPWALADPPQGNV